MATIQRFRDWTRVEGNMFAIVFQHGDPKRMYFNLESIVHDSFELSHTYDGVTQYIPEKHWNDLCEVIRLADKESHDFWCEVNAAIDEDSMKEPQGDEDYIAAPDIDAPF